MTWVKLDDSFPEHKKIVELSDRAFRIHVAAICYSARNLTDGHIPPSVVRTLTFAKKTPLNELVKAGLWRENGSGGYLIHDYLEYNPSAEAVKDQRAKRVAAGSAGGLQKWRKAITQDLRQQVARRVGATPGQTLTVKCNYCPVLLVIDWSDPKRVRILDAQGKATPELDHVKALANGGSHTADNLVVSCLSCNRKKGTRDV